MRKLYLILALLFALPAGAQTIGQTSTTPTVLGGTNSTGTMEPSTVCTSMAAISYTAGAAGTSQIIAPAASKRVRICGLMFATSNAVSVNFVESPAGVCNGPDVTGAAPFPAGSGIVLSPSPYSVPFTTTAGSGLCVKVSAATRVAGWISYVLR